MAKMTKAQILAKKAKALEQNLQATKSDMKKSGALYVSEDDLSKKWHKSTKRVESVIKSTEDE